jgi:hypothetical protein
MCGEQGLAAFGLDGVPARTNQDQRDAIAAAVTASQHTLALTEMMGDIVVPAGRWSPAGLSTWASARVAQH